jgi:hypothetical protein
MIQAKEIAKDLEKKKPYLSAMLSRCKMFTETSASGWMTVHLSAPDAYTNDMLSTRPFWIPIHDAIEAKLGHSRFTLNFPKVKSTAPSRAEE